MRENLNCSFTPYEWKPIKKKMEETGLNRYNFLRYCVFKECGVEIDRKGIEEKQSSIGNRESNSHDESGNDGFIETA